MDVYSTANCGVIIYTTIIRILFFIIVFSITCHISMSHFAPSIMAGHPSATFDDFDEVMQPKVEINTLQDTAVS